MIVKFLGISDLISALLVLLIHYGVGNFRFPLIVSMYLLIKGFSFRKDFQSWIDIAIGVYIWFVFLGFATFLDYIIVLYLIQKGFVSFI